jgi:hypothetical protein
MVFFKKRSIRSKPRSQFVRKKAFNGAAATTTKVYAKPNLVRFRPSRKTYWKNRSIKNSLVKFSESKLLSLDSFTQDKPNENSPGSLGQKWNTVLGGGVPATWTGFIDQSLGGISYTKGIDQNNRIGDYMYLRHSTLQYLIEMDSGVNDPFRS